RPNRADAPGNHADRDHSERRRPRSVKTHRDQRRDANYPERKNAEGDQPTGDKTSGNNSDRQSAGGTLPNSNQAPGSSGAPSLIESERHMHQGEAQPSRFALPFKS